LAQGQETLCFRAPHLSAVVVSFASPMLYCCSTQKHLRLATSEEDAKGGESNQPQPITQEDIDNLGTEYVLPEDPYTNAVLEMMTPGGGRNVISAVCGIIFMLGMAVMQVGLTYAVLAERHHLENNEVTLVDNVVCDSQLEGVPRISSGNAEAICGSYAPVKDGADGVFYETPAGHGWDPNLWPKDELSLLTETMSQMAVIHPTCVEFWVLFTALVAWGAAILAELVDSMRFARVLCSLPTGYSLQDNSGVQLVGLHPCQKALACVIGAYRMILGVFLGYVGVRFLNSNVAVSDIILNSVALAFVLEVDTLVYKAYAHFRGGLASQQVVAMMPARNDDCLRKGKRYFPRACAGMTILAALCIFACLAMQFEWQSLTAKFNTYSSICLFFGPTPNMDERFDVAFPVPGLCESLVCDHTDTKTLRCLAKEADAIKKYEKYESVKHLYGVCSTMLQASISSTYKVQADGQNESLSDRQTDADLGPLGVGDLASNFWCPASVVSQLFNIPNGSLSPNTDFAWWKSYAKYLCDASEPVFMEDSSPDLSVWKFYESEFKTANVSCQSPILAVKNISSDDSG